MSLLDRHEEALSGHSRAKLSEQDIARRILPTIKALKARLEPGQAESYLDDQLVVPIVPSEQQSDHWVSSLSSQNPQPIPPYRSDSSRMRDASCFNMVSYTAYVSLHAVEFQSSSVCCCWIIKALEWLRMCDRVCSLHSFQDIDGVVLHSMFASLMQFTTTQMIADLLISLLSSQDPIRRDLFSPRMQVFIWKSMHSAYTGEMAVSTVN